jgi:hypothetical protein
MSETGPSFNTWGVPAQEVGRWACEKCGRICIAMGPRKANFPGTGAFVGPCPWGCGVQIRRGFRFVKSGTVSVVREAEANGGAQGSGHGG